MNLADLSSEVVDRRLQEALSIRSGSASSAKASRQSTGGVSLIGIAQREDRRLSPEATSLRARTVECSDQALVSEDVLCLLF